MYKVLILAFAVGCSTTKATFQERLDCRKTCGGSMKDVCKSGYVNWVICDCDDGKRYRISNWE